MRNLAKPKANAAMLCMLGVVRLRSDGGQNAIANKEIDDGSKMKKIKTTIITLSFLSLAANIAVARDWDRDDDYRWCRGRHCVTAPEIDPAQAMGALALLGGTVAIIRGYRRRKK